MKKYRLILSATVLTALLLVSALPVSAFQDVPRDQWYSEGVDYITEKRYMNGVGRDMFAPQALVTRGMLVTVLYRISGMPEPGPESGFMDVEPGSYYEPAAAWAAANGIVTGCSTDVFGPNDAVMREQFATILYRHADYSGLDPVSSGELDAYADRGEISSFAVPAAKWAIGNGVITGTGPAAFSPKGTTTRAQMAVMLMRYLNMGTTPSDTPSEALAGEKRPRGERSLRARKMAQAERSLPCRRSLWSRFGQRRALWRSWSCGWSTIPVFWVWRYRSLTRRTD